MSLEKPDRHNFQTSISPGNTSCQKNTVELTEKAMKFVDNRRQDVDASAYVSSLLENLYDYARYQSVNVDEINILDTIEGRTFSRNLSAYEKSQASMQTDRDMAMRAINILRESHEGPIPYAEFHDLCNRLGLNEEEIEIATRRYSAHIAQPVKSPDGDILELSIKIYDYLRSVFGDRVPAEVFKRKCLERGIKANEFESIKELFDLS